MASSRLIEDVLQLLVDDGSNDEFQNLLDHAAGRDDRDLRIEATQSLSEHYRRKPNLKTGQSVSGRAVQERRPIIVADVTKEQDYMYPDMKKEGLCSLLSVPMMVREKAGVINSYTSVPHAFTRKSSSCRPSPISGNRDRAYESPEKSFEMREALVRKLLDQAKGYLMRSKKLTKKRPSSHSTAKHGSSKSMRRSGSRAARGRTGRAGGKATRIVTVEGRCVGAVSGRVRLVALRAF